LKGTHSPSEVCSETEDIAGVCDGHSILDVQVLAQCTIGTGQFFGWVYFLESCKA
jgi:hypothetical protein